MARFIHLADDRKLKLILKNGIKVQRRAGETIRGVYATPVLPDYYLSHQWIRELKRRGIQTISAVQFKLPGNTPVRVGRYNEDHIDTTAAESVRIFMEHDTGLGLEVIFLSSIPAEAITGTYTPEQITGWRYYPESHSDGRKPCGCEYCQRGQIKNRKLRKAYEAGLGL